MQAQALNTAPNVTAGYWGAGQPGNQRSDNFAAYKALVDSGISLIDTAEASKPQHDVDGLWCCPDCGVTALLGAPAPDCLCCCVALLLWAVLQQPVLPGS